jgi:predicted flap endonuclease-1-like 5' DNA nuclease
MPEAVNEWARQVHEIMDNWVHVQSRLWDEMFKMMKAAGQTPPGSATAVPAKRVSAQPPEAAQIAPSATDQPAGKDDLKVLAGLGPVTEKRLNASGITSFRQLAGLSAEAVKDIETKVLKQPGRFKRYDLIAQAKAEHEKKYHETL